MTKKSTRAKTGADNVIARGVDRYTFGALPRIEPPAPSARLTDVGNAARLVARHGHELRYSYALKKWLAYDGTRWRTDSGATVVQRAKATVADMLTYAYGDSNNGAQERRALLDWCAKSQDARRLSAMIELARCEVAVEPEQFDADPWCLNVANGELDLRTRTLSPHQPSHLLTKIASVVYDPAAGCPTWDAFLSRIFDGNETLIAFVQRALGYALTAVIREHVLVILYGRGSNGKSTLLETVQTVVGDYALRTPVQTLMSRAHNTIPNDVARLRGARLVVATESDETQKLAEATVKHLTGGDTISARYLFGEWFQFAPSFKLFLGTNHKPVIKGTDHAIWRRIRIVPFTVQIPKAEQDDALKDKLLLEAPGILRWLVEGCAAWHAEGLGVPRDVEAATQEYRDEMDVLGLFLTERCEVNASAGESSSDLYAAYEDWAKKAGEKTVTKKAFGLALEERGFSRDRTKRRRMWKGLKLSTEPSSDPDLDMPG